MTDETKQIKHKIMRQCDSAYSLINNLDRLKDIASNNEDLKTQFEDIESAIETKIQSMASNIFHQIRSLKNKSIRDEVLYYRINDKLMISVFGYVFNDFENVCNNRHE